MTAPQNGSVTCALVLGGGVVVGVGWQTGLLEGLREAGLDLAGSQAIVGTSAGALVGALLASGRQVVDALTALAALGQRMDPHHLAVGNEAFLTAQRQACLGTDRRQGGKSDRPCRAGGDHLRRRRLPRPVRHPRRRRMAHGVPLHGSRRRYRRPGRVGPRLRRIAAARGCCQLFGAALVPHRHNQRPPLHGRRHPQSPECRGGASDRRSRRRILPSTSRVAEPPLQALSPRCKKPRRERFANVHGAVLRPSGRGLET